jgi:RNA polymerase sigma factor (sigma-70 family)
MDGRDEFFSSNAVPGEERILALVMLCHQGERMAQSELYKLSFDFLYRVAIRYEKNHDDAIEVINEAFYKVLKNLHTYKTDSSFYPWVKTILLHCIFNKFKKSNTIRNGRDKAIVSMEDEYKEVSVEPGILNKIDSEHVLAILRCLPELTRKVFNLFVMEDYSHKDIAELLGISVNASKWHVYEGKKRLTERLRQTYNEEHGTGK